MTLKSLKQNFALFIFSAIGIGLLTFSVWSHFYQDKQIKNIVVRDGDDVLIGASTLFAQNASVQFNFEVLGTYASVSGNFSFNGEVMPDGATCSNGQILKRTGANDWDCATDSVGSVASNSLDFDEFVNAMTLDANTTITNGAFALTLTAASMSYGEFTVNASATAYLGSAFTSVGDCNDDGEAIGWTTTGIFICNTLADADIPDSITITNLSGTNTGDVTLAGTPDYITILGQTITRTKLDISDDTNLTAGTDLTLTTNDLTLDSTLTQAFSFTNTGSQSMTGSLNVSKGLAFPSGKITASGNVGIGTTGPARTLQVKYDSDTDYLGTDTTTWGPVFINNSTSGALNSAGIKFGTETNGEGFFGLVSNAGNTAGDFVWVTRDSGARAERMRLTSAGNVGIGTTGPLTRFDVVNTASDGGIVRFADSDGACTHNPESGAETVVCSSDSSLKKNIKDSGSVLDKLKKFRIREY